MRRATMVILSAVMLLTLVAGPADAGSRLQKTTGPLPMVQGYVIEGACPFPVIWIDRGGRTLTTWERDHTIVSQRITGTSKVVLTNGASGLELTFDIKETTTIVYDQQRGTRDDAAGRIVGARSSTRAPSPARARSPGTAARR